jgi:multiple antibiotic resistance protein
MEHWTEYTRFTTALLVIPDPFIAVPPSLPLTRGQRMRIAFITSDAVAVSGDGLLAFAGTGLASLRVAGGIVLLPMALAMLRTTITGKKTTGEMPGIAVVPLAIPAGRGAISTVMIRIQHSALCCRQRSRWTSSPTACAACFRGRAG